MRAYDVILLKNASATGAGQPWEGGRGFVAATGTFGGATLALEYLGPDGTTWLTSPVVSLTAVGGALFELPVTRIRASLTGGAPAGINCRADRIPV